jgi:nitric oxide reductase subunit B
MHHTCINDLVGVPMTSLAAHPPTAGRIERSSGRLWRWLGLVFVLSFGALGYLGWQIYRPRRRSQAGRHDRREVLYTGAQIRLGQQAWMSAGGQQLGTVWGHGAYVAPDWSADWLHREAETLTGDPGCRAVAAGKRRARPTRPSSPPACATRCGATPTTRPTARSRCRRRGAERSSGWRALRRPVRHRPDARQAARAVRDDRRRPAREGERQALPRSSSGRHGRRDRPAGETGLSYTSNWPHEPLVGNTMGTSAAMWSMVSIILLLAGIAAMLGCRGAIPTRHERGAAHRSAARRQGDAVDEGDAQVLLRRHRPDAAADRHGRRSPRTTRSKGSRSSACRSRRCCLRREPHDPHADRHLLDRDRVARAPARTSRRCSLDASRSCRSSASTRSSGADRRRLGSTITGWLGTLQHRGVDFSFWLGNQGLEFTSMGRIWQILLFVGLLFWVFLLGRALWPALKKPSETRGLIAMVFLSATCIGGFYATSLTWGQHTHYSMIEYWRWWLVHLWVEGFFEVFATAVVALIFTNSA